MVNDFNFLAAILTVQIRSISMVAALKADGDQDTIITVQADGETKELIEIINSLNPSAPATLV